MSTGIVDTEKSQPYAVEGASRIGRPPVAGVGGERGTNAFGGTDEYDQNGIATSAAPGPLKGTLYHGTEGGVTATAWGGAPVREDASAVDGLLVPNLVLSASSLTPVHAVSVTLTATASSGSSTLVSGTVTFKDGATTLGTGVLSGEVATLVVSGGFTTGSHTLTAVLPASGAFEAKTSAAITLVAS